MLGLLGEVDDEPLFLMLADLEAIGVPTRDADALADFITAADLTDLEAIEAELVALWEERRTFLRYPDVWVRDRLGEWPWSKQREIMRAVATHRKVAVHSSFGIGKDWTAARLICCWIANHEPGQAFVVSTAPTFSQVRAILWREVRQAFGKAHALGRPLPGRVNMTEWLIGSDLVGFGRKPADHDQASFQGIHAETVLVILDEAGGIPEGLFQDAEKLVTTPASRILAIGNPTHEGSYWHKVCTRMTDWHVIPVSAYDTPSYTGEAVPPHVLNMVTSKLWVDEQEAKYTKASPRYQQQVLGQFSKERAMTVVPLAWARAAIHDPLLRPPPGMGPTRLGVDVGAGGDWFVIRAVQGDRVSRAWRSISNDAATNVQLVARAVQESGATEVVIDAGGIGYGMPELIRAQVPYVAITPVDFGERSDVVRLAHTGATMFRWQVPTGTPNDQVREVFANKRAELWWAARERCMLAEDPTYRPVIPYVRFAWDLTALEDPTLIAAGFGQGEDDPTLDELTAPGYEHVQRGQSEVIIVESKDLLRKANRLGASTDHADALLLASYPHPLAPPEVPAAAAPEFGGLSAFGLGQGHTRQMGRSTTDTAPQEGAEPDGPPVPGVGSRGAPGRLGRSRSGISW